MDEFVEYLIQHMILDFDGELNVDTLTKFLADDDSTLARDVRARFAAENGADDFLIVMCDCLRDYIRTGITADKVKTQVSVYIES